MNAHSSFSVHRDDFIHFVPKFDCFKQLNLYMIKNIEQCLWTYLTGFLWMVQYSVYISKTSYNQTSYNPELILCFLRSITEEGEY